LKSDCVIIEFPIMANTDQCTVAACPQVGATTLEGANLCVAHFISVCYSRLEQYDKMQKEHTMSVSEAEVARRFINQCSRQSDQIEHNSKSLDNLDRARLLHIILWANEMGRYLRRSPRKATSIAVRLICDKLGNAWEENTQTVLLSQHGAALQCSRPTKTGEAVQLERLDTGQKVNARVAWHRSSESAGAQIGIEFVDCENFWGLDWDAVEDTR
jgi:PilZ domain-containing protein